MSNTELTWALLAIAFIMTLVGLLIVRRQSLVLRPIPAYVVLPALAADAVESANCLHFSLGSSAVGEGGTVAALASADVFYRMAARVAVGQQMPLVTTSSAVTLSVAQDTLRRAYVYRRNMDCFRANAAAWFPQGPRSLAFAAGATSMASDANVTSSVLLGRFGSELAWFGESALRHDQGLVAHSDYLEGQAIAFVQADDVLIGEELYAGAAYMGGRSVTQGTIVALDVLRWLVIVSIMAYALQAAL